MAPMTSVVIIGGGPGGYEAAHVAVQYGADVVLIDTDGPILPFRRWAERFYVRVV